MQAVYAVMVVTPWIRLSEAILKESILAFYKVYNLIPVGVSEVALPPWADKMAFALHKLVRRFRKLYEESPTSSRSVALQELKQRVAKAGVEATQLDEKGSATCGPATCSQASSVSRIASDTDLEQLPTSEKVQVDWALVLAKLQQKKSVAASQAVVKGPAVDTSVPLGPASMVKPVATPARARVDVPQFVLDGLAKKEAPKPFATVGGEEDQAAVSEKNGKNEPVAAACKKTKKAAVPKRKGAKKKKSAALTPEEEQAMVPPDELDLPEKGKPDESTLKGPYVAGKFSDARKSFIAELRKNGYKYKDANTQWMLSDERASLLEGMSSAELKKRRFA